MSREILQVSRFDQLTSSKGHEASPEAITLRLKHDRRCRNRMPASEWFAAVRWRAYELFLERGCGNGRDVEDWLRAERDLRNMAEHVTSRAA